MTTRLISRIVLEIILFVGLALAFGLSPSRATTSTGSPGAAKAVHTHVRQVPPLDHMEFEDDPPLPAAQPIPGAARSLAIHFNHVTTTQVNVDANGANIPGDAANEPSLAVDPTNPLHMVIGWRQFDNVSSNFRQAGYGYTTDEGRTWTFPGVFTPGTFRSDPVLGRTAEGDVGYMSLKEDFTMDYFRSTDNGVTWASPVPAFGGDKEWLTLDHTSGIGHDNIYSFYTASANFIRSTNGGGSFRNPSSIPSSPHWGTMTVAPDGELDLVGVDNSYTNFVFSKSTDAKDPNDTATSFTTLPLNLGGVLQSFTGPNPEGLAGQPWIAIDSSTGPRAGWIYAVCSVDPSGSDPLDVHFTRSSDHGATWTPWVRINDDAGTSAWQWFGTMSVAPNGRIDVVWNDTRGSSLQNVSALYYSYSTNGGFTWAPNQQISPTWDSFVGWPNQDKIGDYYGMTSDLVGANLAWAATFNNEQDVYYTRIGDYDCNGNGVGDSLDVANGTSHDSNHNGIPDECEGLTTSIPDLAGASSSLGNHPNPFDETTTIRFEMPVGGGQARLQIFDVGGKLVRTLLEGEARGGANSVVWDGTDDQHHRLPDGPYFYQLTAPGSSEARQMVLLR
jgi:hypothetical protein